MATRVAASATDLAEDTWVSGAANTMALLEYTPVEERTFITWGCCVSQKLSGTSALPHLQWSGVGMFPMIDQRNALDYSLALTSIHVTYGVGEGGGFEQFAVHNVGA